MAADRSPIGWLTSALGAIVLVVSVFLPWYALSLTAQGVALIQQLQSEQVQRFGNATLQGELGSLHARVGALAGQQLGTITAHQAFSTISVVLLVAGGLGILLSLLPLARQSSSDFDGTGPWLALLGLIAAACVLYRMGVRPAEDATEVSLTLREGAWLALLGSVAMVAGGLWPRRLRAATASNAALDDAWSGLSGWTPES
jgi:uncharacterized membrane protein YiaA